MLGSEREAKGDVYCLYYFGTKSRAIQQKEALVAELLGRDDCCFGFAVAWKGDEPAHQLALFVSEEFLQFEPA